MDKLLKEIAKSKWTVLVASIWILGCAGNSYNFSIYSPILKERLEYDQKQLDGLGVAKDLGDNIGILSGVLSDLVPPSVVLLMGIVQNFLGYGGLWLAAIGRFASPKFWQVCVLLCAGTNGGTYFVTTTLVSCMRSFPKSRGVVSGIATAFIGLSGAIFAQLYTSLYSPDQASFLFLLAIGPAAVTLVLLLLVRPVPNGPRRQHESRMERANFGFMFLVCFALAVYLLGAILLQSVVTLPHAASMAVAAFMLLLLVLPGVIPVKTALAACRHDEAVLIPSDQQNGWHAERPHGASAMPCPPSSGSAIEDLSNVLEEGLMENASPSFHVRVAIRAPGKGPPPDENLPNGLEAPLLPDGDADSIDVRQVQDAYLSGEPLDAPGVAQGKLGLEGGVPNMAISEILLEANFWLLYIALIFSTGAGLTVVSNLAQVGQAQGYDSVSLFVSLMSVWSFLGRILFGGLSEQLLRRYALPRSLSMAAAQAAMLPGFLLFAFAVPGSLYGGSLLVGLSFGAICALMPAIAADLFGDLHLGTTYNMLLTSAPIGSYFLSSRLAGYLYDIEAEKDAGGPAPQLAVQAGTWSLSFQSPPSPSLSLSAQLLSACSSSSDSASCQRLASLQGSHGTAEFPAKLAKPLLDLACAKGGWQPSYNILSLPLNPISHCSFGKSSQAVCMGSHCFKTAFLVMTAVCTLSIVLYIIVAVRSRPTYKKLSQKLLDEASTRGCN